LCTRSISAASFAFAEGETLGVALGVGLGVGLGDTAMLAVGDGGVLTDASGLAGAVATADVAVAVGDATRTESCVESRPAIARPTASTATSVNGRNVKARRARRMARRYGFFETVTTA